MLDQPSIFFPSEFHSTSQFQVTAEHNQATAKLCGSCNEFARIQGLLDPTLVSIAQTNLLLDLASRPALLQRPCCRYDEAYVDAGYALVSTRKYID